MSYTNANSHNFRDTSGYEPQKQIRVKCHFCGCWAKKGRPCYQCHRTADGTLVKPPHRKSSSQVEPESEAQAENVHDTSDWMYDQLDTPPDEHDEEAPKGTGAGDDGGVGEGKDTPTKYTNANNHHFRETSPFDPQKQVREKCKFCGCWAKKGCACYQCHRLPDGTLVKVPPRKISYRAEHEHEQLQRPEGTAPNGSARPTHVRRPHPVRAKSIPDNVLQHQFREPVPYDVSCKQRQKCPACGCWVTKGKVCTLCKRVTT